jgi:hypothetical protein
MNLLLHVSKRDDIRDSFQSYYIRFAVVDLDKSQCYPLNFVCMLPQQVSGNGKQYSVFTRVFGNHSLELAKQLLTKALETADDSEIKAEIEKRLKLLEPKPIQIKCHVCGKSFEPQRTGRFKQKTCQECRRKKNPNQE